MTTAAPFRTAAASSAFNPSRRTSSSAGSSSTWPVPMLSEPATAQRSIVPPSVPLNAKLVRVWPTSQPDGTMLTNSAR